MSTLRPMTRPLLAVDAPFVLYRSFFALPDSIHGLDDRPVNALLGAVNVLLRIAADRDPRTLVICFGAEAAPYRVELFPKYHADRPPVPHRQEPVGLTRLGATTHHAAAGQHGLVPSGPAQRPG